MAQQVEREPPPTGNDADDGGKLLAILTSQRRTLRLFLSHPPTRTPTIVLYVASFGGALHAAVTTYFYLAVGASETDIGQFGFIMSAGALMGSPLSGMALDKYGPWLPISVTAGTCAWGCLWRGVASSLASLRMGAILLGVGINLWTVVLGHLVKSFPPSMRSEVLSGFGLQMTVLQLCGKGMFPLVEYMLHRVAGLDDSLLRYRIHMGMCTFFCFYGTFALLWDRENVRSGGGVGEIQKVAKYQQKHSDVVDELEKEGISSSTPSGQPTLPYIQSKEIELMTTSTNDDSIYSSFMSDRDSGNGSITEKSCNTSSSSFLNEQDSTDHDLVSQTNITQDAEKSQQRTKHLLTTMTLTFALLVQSISTTIVTVLWPLLARDRFDLSAHAFGILTFSSSVTSAGAVASFPVVERLDKIGGRVRCAAWGFGLGAMLCLTFCYSSFGDYRGGVEGLVGMGGEDHGMSVQVDTDNGRLLLENHDALHRVESRQQFTMHVVSVIAFQAVLCFLEPSLKSILSLAMTSPPSVSRTTPSGSSLGLGMGLMNTLGNVGGMIGNLAGTWMYKFSKDASEDSAFIKRQIIQGGSLPFLVTAALMAVSSILIWRLEEPPHVNEATGAESMTIVSVEDVEAGLSTGNASAGIEGSSDNPEKERPDSCCLALRETTYDLKLD